MARTGDVSPDRVPSATRKLFTASKSVEPDVRPPPKTLDETLACKYVTESRVFHRDAETPRDSLLRRYPKGCGLGKFHPVRRLKGFEEKYEET